MCTALAGFARTYFPRPLVRGLTPAPADLRGVRFTGWVFLCLAQVRLVAAKRIDLRRRLGSAVEVLASLGVAVGTLTALPAGNGGAAVARRRGFENAPAPPPGTLWGGLLLVVSDPLRLVLAQTDGWLRVSDWLVDLVKQGGRLRAATPRQTPIRSLSRHAAGVGAACPRPLPLHRGEV